MQAKIFQADSVEAAIKAGLKELGVAQEEVEVEVIQEARKGFLGIGARDAIVKLFVKAANHSEESQREAVEDAEDPVHKSVADPANEASDERIFGADDRQGQGQQSQDPASDSVEEVQTIAPEEESVLAKDPSQEDSRSLADPVQDSVAEEALPSEADQASPSEAESDLDSQEDKQAAHSDQAEQTETATEDQDDKQFYDVDFPARYIIDVCEAYGVEVTVDVEDHDREIIYHINTDKPGLVIGKHGKILNSLEALAKVLVHRHVRNRVNVVVNVGDYRERRLKTLERLAERTADEVTVKQSSVQLSPLPANERKIVHQALSKYDHIETRSEGREPHRYLIVDYRH
ncbi:MULTISPECIES: RNA-binding cell elongation regulator Jag/EloR [unclassified Aerococcus]|uniref:RNA-binding cell elongation regulator Jag/EloR n=1 Tax=unclassified Aerococcus TaxID=2618060 RepID=UPI0008A5CBD2|nr:MULTISPECIES: RNA-binding cell elongation regulator Jag/EloR [unclassified Aerococcus]MDK6369335.1 RNA-binding cell elongation regulator Jag/EloR [Aerococcus sp. UMB9870]MDK6679160.1 RNA-binding cell elongation regulator Jag/EloR [Aerococcus sp. UMB8608]MDK6687155.1 RNA-binding cell elongation regulator Jag/EloR [Aerococcus sp. UMB8623]MDK6941111.1 RNA-binding cell elongation regulator Jag/EloR [Aerococcus sp. UMB8487]OFK13495.1 hypothetical protein HMPREF2829_05835 [Aerococcus sp. HMSC072A